MLNGLVPGMRAYLDIINVIPSFSATLDDLEGITHDIFLLTKDQKIDIAGVTAEKRDRRENLILFAIDDSKKISAYALVTNNIKLSSEIKFTKTYLRTMSDIDLMGNVDLIFQRAEEHIGGLVNYGITPETQTQQKQRRDAFFEMLNAPRIEQMKQTQVTSQLAALFDKAEVLVKRLDTIVEIVRMSHPDFYAVYQKARKVVTTGRNSISLRGTVLDAATGEPVLGATITIAAIDGTPELGEGQLVKESAAKGGFNVKSLPDGMYRITVIRPGYKDSTIDIIVSSSELTVVEIKLERK